MKYVKNDREFALAYYAINAELQRRGVEGGFPA